MVKNYRKIAVLSCLVFSQWAYANHDVSDIKQSIQQAVAEQITLKNNEKLSVDVVDNNTLLQFSRCNGKLEFKFPNNTHSEMINSVDIICNAEQGWHKYVALDVKVLISVLVAKQTITPKETITDDDLEYAEHNKNRLYTGFLTNKAEAIGNIATHLLPAGTVLNTKNIQAPAVIHKNQIITIISKRNQISVSMQGIAKSDGAQNTMIKVFNPSSKRLLDAMVIDRNSAQVVS